MSTKSTEENTLVRLHEPAQKGWWSGLVNSRERVLRYRFLVHQLVKINIQKDYKRSFIGLSWLIILPLLAMAVWMLMNGAGIIEPGETDIPYPAYVLLSTSIWGFFAELYRSSSNMLTSSGRLFLAAPFPFEVQVVENILVHVFRFLIPFGLNIIVLLFFGVKFSWVSLLFPFTLIPLLLLGLSIGLIISLFRVVAADLGVLADESMRLLMFLTPIVYAPGIQLGWLSDIVRINPLTYLVSFSRDVLINGNFYEPQIYFGCCLGTLVFFFLMWRVYATAQPLVVERLIAA